ncbi:MAG TPA: PDZ domain-containing protein [Pirellulales bacterium]|nr:PDZ domain-containing protein [Pirellulales bacterium]
MRFSLRPRYSLRLLLVVVTAFSIWLGLYIARVREQRSVIAALEAMNFKVEYSFETDEYGASLPKSHSPPGPAWLRTWLGDDFFANVTAVHDRKSKATDDDLRLLLKLPQLKYVSLVNTAAGDELIRGLQQSFPALTVRHRKFAFLGTVLVQSKTVNGCVIGGVAKESPAEAAGLQKGDVVLAVDDVAIKRDSDLILQISRYWPGDRVWLRVRRGDAVIQTIATLRLFPY